MFVADSLVGSGALFDNYMCTSFSCVDFWNPKAVTVKNMCIRYSRFEVHTQMCTLCILYMYLLLHIGYHRTYHLVCHSWNSLSDSLPHMEHTQDLACTWWAHWIHPGGRPAMEQLWGLEEDMTVITSFVPSRVKWVAWEIVIFTFTRSRIVFVCVHVIMCQHL